MSPGMRWDRAARRDMVVDGGADDPIRGQGGAAWGSKPATKVQLATIEKLRVDPLLPERFRAVPSGRLTRNAAKRWISKARAQIALAAARADR